MANFSSSELIFNPLLVTFPFLSSNRCRFSITTKFMADPLPISPSDSEIINVGVFPIFDIIATISLLLLC